MTSRPSLLTSDRTPPVADRRAHKSTHHGVTREDPYHWLKDDGYPEVTDKDILSYLRQENDYFESVMNTHEDLTDRIFEEIKGRQKQDDSGVPWQDGAYMYAWRFTAGAQYRIWSRRPVAGGEDVTLLDEPALADGHDYFRLGGFAVSPDDRFLAYATDTDGSERFTLRVRDLTTGTLTGLEITETIGAPVWSADGQYLLYAKVNENWRPDRVFAHRIGTETSADVLLHEETDGSFFVGVGKTSSRRFITISSGDHITSEIRLLDADDPLGDPIIVAPREAGHEYDLDHADGRFYIRTNDTHVNFRVVTAAQEAPGRDTWRELIAPTDTDYIRDVTGFAGFIAVTGRRNGLDQVRIMSHDGDAHDIAFPEAAYTVGLGTNEDYETTQLRLGYESMVTPGTVFDYDLASRSLFTRKVTEIPSGYDPQGYETERLIATARDGTEVPVSIVYAKGYKRDGSMPLHVYGYGAYGLAMSPGFSTARLSLLDRGFAYAIAHIRGGDDMGYQWYLDGKLEKRTNTFNDFVDVSRFLVAQGFGRDGAVTASGGSAGGELMGAVVNQAPDLWGAIVAHVPFVDVLNTMLDTSLPLTPMEWPEWGNPIEDWAAFDHILSYSPYDQVEAKDYPALMITAGLNDPRVTYWEPAKWTAKLRHLKTDDNVLIFKTNMGAGHGGKSGRFRRFHETAEEYSFLIRSLGLEED